VLLVFGAPRQLRLLPGQEHGRTIPLADLTSKRTLVREQRLRGAAKALIADTSIRGQLINSTLVRSARRLPLLAAPGLLARSHGVGTLWLEKSCSRAVRLPCELRGVRVHDAAWRLT
jgi:hypothetical protein